MEAYTAKADGTLNDKPAWRYSYDYADVVAEAQNAAAAVVAEPAVKTARRQAQIQGRRQASASEALDIYEALDSSNLLQSLLVNLGF